MRIGIDGSCLSNRRGFGRFARQLLEALSQQATQHRFTVFVDRPSAAAVAIPESFERVVVDVREAPSRAASARGRRRWRDMFAMGLAVARSGIDLMYFPGHLQLLPGLERGEAGRDHARHAAADSSGAGVSHPARPPRLAAQGNGRGRDWPIGS